MARQRTVYRLEKGGVGIYKAMVCYDMQHGYDDYQHPSPYDDFRCTVRELAMTLMVPAKSLRFGFTTRAALNRWFPAKIRGEMGRRGAKLVTYKVPAGAVLATRKQAVFDVERATLQAKD
jgi:hypothetical protein